MKLTKVFLILIFLIGFSASIASAETTRDFFKNHVNSTITIWIGASTIPTLYGTIVDAQDDFIVIDVGGRHKEYICIEYISRWNIEKKK
jgi:hypothetical protein